MAGPPGVLTDDIRQSISLDSIPDSTAENDLAAVAACEGPGCNGSADAGNMPVVASDSSRSGIFENVPGLPVSSDRLSAEAEVCDGVKYDPQTHQLYVAAAISGRAFIYQLAQNSSTTVSSRVVLQLSSNGGYINDVAVGHTAVFFTDSVKPTLYSVPRLVRPEQNIAVSRYDLGPGFTGVSPLREAANGIVEAAPGILIFTHFSEGNLYRLAVHNGSSVGRPLLLQLPAIDGKKVNPDGLWLVGKAGLWVADNFNNRLLKVDFGSTNYTSATVECVVTSPAFNTPTTLTTQGNYLWVVNARFLDCLFFKPCLQQPYEIVGENLSKLCV
eukprot:gene10640-10798_t